MDHLQQTFSMKHFGLTMSFRCPRLVVEHARWRAPEMQYPAWAKPGEVRKLTSGWNSTDLPDAAVILCRNNAPLFSIAFDLMKQGRGVELVGNDLGKPLLKIMKSLGGEKMDSATALSQAQAWRDDKLKTSRSPSKINDQFACIELFLSKGPTLMHAITFCEAIVKTTGPIKLMTGHKSKGLEWDDVFILDEDLIGDNEQERNLRYVMQTRSKSTLTYIYSKDFITEEPTDAN